jgi:cytochrome c oxidase accessory protein FixG
MLTWQIPGADVTASRQKVHPRHQPGRWRSLRTVISVTLQLVLFALPWLQWQGRQALLLDLPGRKIFLFGLVLHPHDTYFLQILMLLAAVLLFFVSAVAGRMWCGYACPQTIFTQSFIMVERLFEGDRAARLRLDKASWDRNKTLRKLGKFGVWLAMGGWLGLTFAGYYFPIRVLFGELSTGHVSALTAGAVSFFTAVSLFLFGYFREQFCHFVCPYARFQSSMIDSDSLIVGYDEARGEPRGKRNSSARGDCIDCTLCVQVCPMGIDIRKGFQMECIACTACIDACDSVMDKVAQPRGLIRYTALNGQKPQLLRPRVVLYGLLLLALSGLFTYLLLHRSALDLDAVRVVQPGGQLANTTPDGRTANVFKIHLINRQAHARDVTLGAEGLDGAEILGVPTPLRLESGEVRETQALVVLPAGSRRGIHPFQFRAGDSRKEATFVVP